MMYSELEKLKADKNLLKLFIRFLLENGVYHEFAFFYCKLKNEKEGVTRQYFIEKWKNPYNWLTGTYLVNMKCEPTISEKWKRIYETYCASEIEKRWNALATFLGKLGGSRTLYWDGVISEVHIPIGVYDAHGGDKMVRNHPQYDATIMPVYRRRVDNFVKISNHLL